MSRIFTIGKFSPDRLTGAACAALGLFLYFVYIPANVEEVDAQFLAPESYPNVLSILLIIFGAALVLLPSKQNPPNAREFWKAVSYMAVISVGFYVLSQIGFMITAPFFALAIMLLMGERRFFWLAGGVVLIPATIWFCVEILLGRSLP